MYVVKEWSESCIVLVQLFFAPMFAMFAMFGEQKSGKGMMKVKNAKA